jgi:teichoic acid transport system permease protein
VGPPSGPVGGRAGIVATPDGDAVTTTSPDPAADLRLLHTQLPTGRYLADMWARRDFVVAMPLEELRASHQDTLLGNLWHLGNPLLTTAVYYFVFGVLLGVDRGIDNFILWLMVGVFAFGLTRGTVMGGSTSITSNLGLMRAIRFPRALLPVSVAISRLITFSFQLGVIVVVALATGEGISRRWLALPLIILVHTALNLGGAFTAARLNDAFRDVRELIPFMFRLLIFVSGVMFPLEVRLTGADIPPPILTLLRLNPIVPLLNMYRWVFLGDPVSLGGVAYALVASGALLAFGFWYFRAAELRYGRA